MLEKPLYLDYVRWLLPKKLGGMLRPPLKDLPRLHHQAGIRGIVSVMDEPSVIQGYKKQGFQALLPPISGGKLSTVEQVKQFIGFVEQIFAQNSLIVVHCTSDNRRTGTLLAAYLKSLKGNISNKRSH